MVENSLQCLSGIACDIGQDTFRCDYAWLDSIALLSDGAKDEVIKAIKAVGLLDFIEELPNKYDTVIGDRGMKLSGGQKQCISIARAILANPKILILDESTAALDAENESRIGTDLRELMQGRTTLTISHQPSCIMSADRVIAIKDGQIVEDGAPSELVGKDGYLSTVSKFW